MSGNALLERIDAYAQAIRERRPLTTDEVKELDAYFRIGMTYTSNALEGNSLTLSETKVLLEDGITVGGKPIRDCYEATGHARAYDYMLETARGGPLQFREEDILRLHALFYGGIDPEHAGRYREGQVFITGTEYVPPTAEEDAWPYGRAGGGAEQTEGRHAPGPAGRLRPPEAGGYSPLPGRQRAHRPAPDESDPGEQGLLCGLHPAHPAP